MDRMWKLMEEQLSMIFCFSNWVDGGLFREKQVEGGIGRPTGENQENCFKYAEFETTTENPSGDIKSAAGRATEANADVNVSSDR